MTFLRHEEKLRYSDQSPLPGHRAGCGHRPHQSGGIVKGGVMIGLFSVCFLQMHDQKN